MKMTTQDKVRALSFAGAIGTAVVSIAFESIDGLKSINDTLLENNINMLDIQNILSAIYYIDTISHFRTQKYMEDYKNIKENYDLLIENISNLYMKLELNNPIEIFATYVYMYRQGYFSYNKSFIYDTKMKDLTNLYGVDVVRGSGVCRSIASMAYDIYKSLHYDASLIAVKASSDAIHLNQKLSISDLNISDEVSTFVGLCNILSRITPAGNHLIMSVKCNDNRYIFDPTNDIILNPNGKKMTFSCNENLSFKISSFSSLVFKLFGQIELDKQIFKLNDNLNITYEEYKNIYLNTLKTIKKNLDLLEKFYEYNQELMEYIKDCSDKERSLIQRVIPIIPKDKILVK